MGITCTGDLGFSWTLKLVLVAHLTRPDLAQGDYSFVFLLPLIEQPARHSIYGCLGDSTEYTVLLTSSQDVASSLVRWFETRASAPGSGEKGILPPQNLEGGIQSPA